MFSTYYYLRWLCGKASDIITICKLDPHSVLKVFLVVGLWVCGRKNVFGECYNSLTLGLQNEVRKTHYFINPHKNINLFGSG